MVKSPCVACYSSITLIGLQKKVIEPLDEATTTRNSKSALNTFHTVSNTEKDKDTYTVSFINNTGSGQDPVKNLY